MIYRGYQIRQRGDKFYVFGMTAVSLTEAKNLVDDLISSRAEQKNQA